MENLNQENTVTSILAGQPMPKIKDAQATVKQTVNVMNAQRAIAECTWLWIFRIALLSTDAGSLESPYWARNAVP